MEDEEIPTIYEHFYSNSKGESGMIGLNVIPTEDPNIYKIDTESDESKKKFESAGITQDEVEKLSNLEVENYDGHFIRKTGGRRRSTARRRRRRSSKRKSRKTRKSRKARNTHRKY